MTARIGQMGGIPRGVVSSARCGGFTLMAMLVALLLLSVFAVIACEVFNNCMLAMRGAAQIQNQVNSYEGLLARLREDVWAAKSVRVMGMHQLAIVDSAGEELKWQIADSGELTRSDRSGVCRWRRLNVQLSFAPHPAGLLLKHGEEADQALVIWSLRAAANQEPR